MIEIKDEILYLMILWFLVSKGIDPVLKINNVDPNLVAALRVNDVGCSLFLIPFVHSHCAHGRVFGRWRDSNSTFPGRREDETRACRMARASEVMTNNTKNEVVSLCSSVVAPRAPNAVCEPPPPNAPARSAPFPCCTRTTRIRKTLMMMCRTTSKTIMGFVLTG